MNVIYYQNALLVSSIYATCFGRVDQSHALKYMNLKSKIKGIYIYILNL
jgi:hypothetical protein